MHRARVCGVCCVMRVCVCVCVCSAGRMPPPQAVVDDPYLAAHVRDIDASSTATTADTPLPTLKVSSVKTESDGRMSLTDFSSSNDDTAAAAAAIEAATRAMGQAEEVRGVRVRCSVIAYVCVRCGRTVCAILPTPTAYDRARNRSTLLSSSVPRHTGGRTSACACNVFSRARCVCVCTTSLAPPSPRQIPPAQAQVFQPRRVWLLLELVQSHALRPR
jgi:hypothetical protein